MDLPSIITTINKDNNSVQSIKRNESSEELSSLSNNKKNVSLNNNISRNRNHENIKTPPPQQHQRVTNSQSPKQQNSSSQYSQSQNIGDKKQMPTRNSQQQEEQNQQQQQQIINAAAAAIVSASNQRHTNQQSQSLQQSPLKSHQYIQESTSVQQSPQHNQSSHQGNTYFHNADLQDFEILSKLGEGSFSTVYRVRRGRDGNEYALKRIKIMKLNEKERENAVNEVRFLASITCRNIIGYKQAIYDEGVNQLCVIMEYAEGGDLTRVIRHAQKANKNIEEDVIWSYAIQMTNGIKALHDMHILHRDLKAANVFLDKYQTRLMLGDLNVSKKLSSNGLLYTQTGTPYYASPEVWKDKPYNDKSDIWSLGCVIYEMCSLKPPFKGKDMEDLFKKVQKGVYDPIPSHYSNELGLFIGQLLRVNPEQRPGCDEILKFSIIRKKMSDMQHFFEEQISPFQQQNQNELISTIRVGKSLRGLKDKLPQSRYETSQQLSSHSEILQPNQYHRQRKNKYTSHASSSNISESIQPLGLANQSINISSQLTGNKPQHDDHQPQLNINSNSISLRQSHLQQAFSSQHTSPPSQKSPSVNQILLQKQQGQYVYPSNGHGKSRCSSVENKQSTIKLKHKMINPNDQYYYNNNEMNKYQNLNNSQNSILMAKKGNNGSQNQQQPQKGEDPSALNQSIQRLSKEIKMLNSNIYNDEMNNRQKQLHQLHVLQQILDKKIKKKDPPNNSQLYPQQRPEFSVKNSQERSISLYKTPQTQLSQDKNESRSHSIEPQLINNKQYASLNKYPQRINQRSSLIQQQQQQQQHQQQNQTPVLPKIFNNAQYTQNSVQSNTNIKSRDNENIVIKRMKTESTNDSSPTIINAKDNYTYTIDDKSNYQNNQYLKGNAPQRKSQVMPKKSSIHPINNIIRTIGQQQLDKSSKSNRQISLIK